METVCYRLCVLSACVALLAGSCHGSIQGLLQTSNITSNYISDRNNVSEINNDSTIKQSEDNITYLYIGRNKTVPDSLHLETKTSRMETTTPLVKRKVKFPVLNETEESDSYSSYIPSVPSEAEKRNDTHPSSIVKQPSSFHMEVNNYKNTGRKIFLEKLSKIPRPQSDNFLSSELDSRGPNINATESQINAEVNETDEVSDYDTPCNLYLSVVISEYEELDNGSILATDQYPMLYPPEYVWEDLDENNNTILRGCLCLLTNCLRKCCNEGIIHTKEGCAENVSVKNPFQPQFINVDTEEIIKNNTNDIRTVYGNPCAYGSYRLDPLDEEFPEQFFLSPDGLLVTAERNFTAAEYCMEMFEDVGRILPLLCFMPETEEPEYVMEKTNVYMMYPIGMIISLPFLLATFCIYACIHELRNLHGKSLMCHVLSLFTAYTFLAVVQLGGDKIEMTFCKISAFVIFFSFLASFFWLNVMCFDIWWTFSGLRPLRGSVKEREYKKFVMYSIYAWGSPLIMLVVCLIMDLLPGIPNEYVKPEFGKDKCWFSTKSGDLAYFFGPIGIIVLCNIILFIATAIRLIRLKKETKMLKGGESKRHDDDAERQRFNLYLKLFIVMGVNWIMEVISWAVGGPEYLWYITDLGNTLQGVLIFVIFVWKQKIRRLLAKKFFPKLARTSIYEGSTKSHPIASRTSSINNTYRTSISTQDQLVLKPLPNGAYRVNGVA